MGGDYNLRKYFEAILQITNSSGLTPGEAYFVLRCVTNELEKAYLQTSQQEPKVETKTVETDIPIEMPENTQDKAD